MDILKNNHIDDFNDLLKSSPINYKYEKLWPTLNSVGYKEEDIQVIFAEKILDEDNKLISFVFYLFYDEKIVTVTKDETETLRYNITEFAGPVVRKTISTTYRVENEKELTLILRDGKHFTWSTDNIFKYVEEYDIVSKMFTDIYKMY